MKGIVGSPVETLAMAEAVARNWQVATEGVLCLMRHGYIIQDVEPSGYCSGGYLR